MAIKANGEHLKIAVQRSGRLSSGSLELLHSVGLDFEHYEGRLLSPCCNFPVDLLFLRDDDIPEYVQDGVADLGIVGRNVVLEKAARVETVEHLGFGACRLQIAVPRESGIKDVSELAGQRIATSYPTVLDRFLAERGVSMRVIEISGSVEIAPSLDVADAVCDLVSSGSTLKMNGLEAIDTILVSEAVVIANPGIGEDPQKLILVNRLRARIQSHLRARNTKYVMMNAPARALDAILDVLPGMGSPTVLPLAEDGMIAVHSAVPEEVFWDVMDRLREIGARDILVVPVEKMVR